MRRPGTIVQLGYVVADIEQAALAWAARGAGPFFVIDTAFHDVSHRGRPARFPLTTAHGQLGDLQIELMLQVDDEPSVVRERFAAGETGLHHVAGFTDDLEGSLREHIAAGHATAMRATSEYGLRIAFVDTVAAYGHMWELYEQHAPTHAFFDRVAAAARDWDGKDPVRDARRPPPERAREPGAPP